MVTYLLTNERRMIHGPSFPHSNYFGVFGISFHQSKSPKRLRRYRGLLCLER